MLSLTPSSHHRHHHEKNNDDGGNINTEYPKIKQPPPPFEICRKSIPRSLVSSHRGQFSSDGTLSFMIHPNKRQINIIDTETSQLISTFYHDRNDSSSVIESCCFSKHQHNDVLYCFTNDKKLLCIDSLSGRKLFSAPIENDDDDDQVIFSQSIATKFPKRAKHDDMSDDDSSSFIEYHVVVVASSTRLGMIDHKTNTDITWFADFESPLSSIHYSNDLRLLVCGFNSGQISFYKILGEAEPESIDLVFKQYLSERPITSCTITNIGRNHDFCLVIGTDSTLLDLFYFSDYFKQCDLSQSIDLCKVFETNSVMNLQLKTIQFKTKHNRKDSSVAIIVCNDSNDLFHVGVFDMNSWIKSEKVLEKSLQDYTAETALCSSLLLDIFIEESSIIYSPTSISFTLTILSQKTLFNITYENRMNLAIQEVAQRNVEDIVNRDKRRRLIQMCKERGLTLASDLFNINTIFDMLYDQSLLSVLVEYIQGTVPNTDSNLIHHDDIYKVSTAVNQRFAIHDIKDIMVWIKHKKEFEEKKLHEYLNTFMVRTDASRTIPPLVIAETRNKISMSIQRLNSLRLLISAVINRAKLMEDGATSDVYIPSLVSYDHHIRSIAEYARVGEWFLEIGLLPMSANLFNTSALEKEWKDRLLNPFPPLSEINISRQEFHAIHELLRLESVNSDMHPTFKMTDQENITSNKMNDQENITSTTTASATTTTTTTTASTTSATNTTNTTTTTTEEKFFIHLLLKYACKEPMEYPPKDLSHFITCLFREEPLNDDAFIYKHLAMFYFIIDYLSHGIGSHAADNNTTTKKLNSYAKLFKITTPWQHLTFSLWLLDTKRSNDDLLNEAVQYACCSFAAPNNGLKHRAWNYDIAKILVKCSSFSAANRLLEFSTSAIESEVLKTIIYLTNDMVHLAFQMQRKLSHMEEQRRNVFFCILHYSLLGNFFSDLLTTFPFDETECLWIELFLKNKKNYDLLFSYYILNSNYVDAFNLYSWMLNSYTSTTQAIDARTSYLDLVRSIIPPIQLRALEQQLATMPSSTTTTIFKQLVLKPSLKHPSRLFSERPTLTQKPKKIKTDHVASMTSFKAWLENTTKDTTIRIPSLFDHAPKWKQHRPKKTAAPQLSSQNMRLPSEHKIIEERKKTSTAEEEDHMLEEETSTTSESETSLTSSEASSLEDKIPAESSTSRGVSTLRPPPPQSRQLAMKTLPPKASPKYSEPLEISDEEEEEGEAYDEEEETNQEENELDQMHDEEEEQPVSVRKEPAFSNIFDEEENTKGSPSHNSESGEEEESAEEETSVIEE
ncbi:hypothetical protein C9374_004920 [Naegleria lovaniensis]|uniref:ELYS-like domain-containing protein n=1 Tax=Naegleria lovaniensis TaxID=51637 RepID=A0AA88KKF8_NAELO|nr:uncharacterized protein C9374_004920 [Naegleria lovaniensis]KAG2382953.1 hypothetical protein C9374_004920 [Naegleria lovaniensis]